LLQFFIQGARLRQWLSRLDCPPAIAECKWLLDKHINLDHINTTTAQLKNSAMKPWQPVPNDLAPLISQKHTMFHAYYQCGGVFFSQHSTHIRNSLVMFFPLGGGAPVPGCNEYIFEEGDKTQFAICHHLPTNTDTVDSFRHYPYFLACLYSKDLEAKMELVDPINMVSHFVRWQFSSSHIIVLSLTKV
ncbi:hypothetical protein J3R82DRAFT_11180, partial [Butyriboletus roseoflavus]